MTYLVTGTAGFIGNHVALSLLRAGHAVTGIDNLTDYYDLGLKRDRRARLLQFSGYTDYETDLADSAAVKAIFSRHKPNFVIHLAAQAGVRHSLSHPEDYLSSNLAGFLSVLEAVRANPARHLLYASTSSVYGANTKQPFAETDTADHPLTFYAATKRANEMMAHAYSHLFNIPSSALRFFTVYGPWGRPDMAYFKFTKAITEGRPIDIYNHGQMSRDFTYIDDIVDGIIRLCPVIPKARPAKDGTNLAPDGSTAGPFEVYNIGNSQLVPLMDFIQALETAIGKKAIKNMMPMQMGDVHSTLADVSKLSNACDFAPNTPVEDGLQKFVDWYKDYYGR